VGDIELGFCPGERSTIMTEITQELDAKQAAYKEAVEDWIVAIREEEALASVAHNIAEIDRWEAAHFHEDKVRSRVKAAKKAYEDALRLAHFDF
jgi:hypothetical protein